MPISVMQRVQLRKLQWDLIKTAVDLKTKGLEVGSSGLDDHLAKYGKIKGWETHALVSPLTFILTASTGCP